MTSPGMRRRLFHALLVLGVTVLGAGPVGAEDPIQFVHQLPGDSKPIVLHADEVSTWLDGTTRIIMLKGRVLVEHGVVHARMQQAVAWVDQERFKRTGVMNVDLYAEGDVRVERGPENRSGGLAFIGLSTRGEIKLKAKNGKVLQQPRPQDALYQRAQAVRAPKASAPPASPIQRTSAQQPAAIAPPPGLPTPPPGQPVPAPVVPSPVLPPGGPPPPVSGNIQGGPPPPGSTQAPVAAAQPPLPELPALPLPTPSAPGTVPLGPPPSPPPRAGLDGPLRQFSIVPRNAPDFDTKNLAMPNGEYAIVVDGGVILNVRTADGAGFLDIEADRLVFWTRDNPRQILGNLRRSEGETTRQLEFYLSGNVEIREQRGGKSHTLRANEVYYDVGRNAAVAMQADLEYRQPGLPDPVHLKAEELLQLERGQYRAVNAEVFSSRLPSDPGLKVYVSEATLEEVKVPKRSIFGRQVVNRQTGQPETEEQRLFLGRNVFLEVENVPVFYTPFLQGDANDPLGPLENVRFGQDQIFGTQISLSWNVYDLLGITPLAGTRWRFDTDYLSDRGPGLGTQFDYAGTDLFGLSDKCTGLVKAYGIYDTGVDVLGGPRTGAPHTPWRGRFLWRQSLQELPVGFTFQHQLSALSDKNFLEEYFKTEFDNDINQETFAYLKQQQDNWAWTLLGEQRIRSWVTETNWLPRADGWLLGQSFFDIFTYNVHGNAGYAQLLTTSEPPPPVVPTDVNSSLGRFDLWQELSLPFTLGPFRLVPYGVLDLTQYTEDLTGDPQGRLYGAGGVRGSVPFSHLYPTIESDLFNLNGLYHKVVFGGNYYIAGTNTPFSQLPQLDRFDDDATDQARRDITPLQPTLNPQNGVALATSPLFNPQTYGIRRLVDNRVDTLDTIEVYQADVRQRWQTKRGYPGMQHTVDWMALDLSASLFPHPGRDNFGENWAFLEYDWLWNIGDRTALTSTGWVDPFSDGARVFTLGSYFNRPDRTSFFLGFRYIDPVDSRAVTGAVTYVFSPKYALTASTMYDFGTQQSQSNSLVLTRMGSDLQLSLGINYNAILNNFGVTVEVLPNLVAQSQRMRGAFPGFGSSIMGR